MLRIAILIFSFLALFSLSINCVQPIFAQDLQRGYRNYKALLNKQKKLQDLSPEEQKEVVIIIRALKRSGGYDQNDNAECREAREQANSAASELEDYARRLMNCASSLDFNDDCYTEFRRTKSAYDDYESAVSEVQSNCQ